MSCRALWRCCWCRHCRDRRRPMSQRSKLTFRLSLVSLVITRCSSPTRGGERSPPYPPLAGTGEVSRGGTCHDWVQGDRTIPPGRRSGADGRASGDQRVRTHGTVNPARRAELAPRARRRGDQRPRCARRHSPDSSPGTRSTGATPSRCASTADTMIVGERRIQMLCRTGGEGAALAGARYRRRRRVDGQVHKAREGDRASRGRRRRAS